MKYYLFLTSLVIGMQSLSIEWVNAQTNLSFHCDVSGKSPRTVVKTPKKEISLIVWESNAFENSGYTADKRCKDVSNRLQMFAKEGSLRYVTTGKINRLNVICVARGRDSNCRPDGLILTLQTDEKPTDVLNSLFNSAFKVSGGKPIVRGEKIVYDLNQVFGNENTNETSEENVKQVILDINENNKK